MTAPCHKCPDRAVGCHAACERYRAYKEANDKRLDSEFFDREAARTQSRYKAIVKGKYGWNRTKN